MKLFDNVLAQLGESGHAFFIRSNQHTMTGVGVAVLGMLSSFVFGLIVARPGISFGEVLGTAGEVAGMALSYGKIAFIPIAFWLLICMTRPFAHAKNSGVASAMMWRLYGAFLMVGVTTPIWLWASFSFGNVPALKIRALAGEWLAVSSFSGNQLMIVMVMSSVVFSVLFYAMVQLGGTVHAHQMMSTGDARPVSYITQPLWIKVAWANFRLAFAGWLAARRVASGAKRTMRQAERQAQQNSPTSEPRSTGVAGLFDGLDDEEDGGDMLDQRRIPGGVLSGHVVR